MLIYENRQDVIDNVKQHVERQLKSAYRERANTTEKSHAGIEARARIAALKGVEFLLTDYTYRNPLEAEAVEGITEA